MPPPPVPPRRGPPPVPTTEAAATPPVASATEAAAPPPVPPAAPSVMNRLPPGFNPLAPNNSRGYRPVGAVATALTGNVGAGVVARRPSQPEEDAVVSTYDPYKLDAAEGSTVTATYPLAGSADLNQLSFDVGDRIKLVRKEDLWSWGKLEGKPTEGWFPNNYAGENYRALPGMHELSLKIEQRRQELEGVGEVLHETINHNAPNGEGTGVKAAAAKGGHMGKAEAIEGEKGSTSASANTRPLPSLPPFQKQSSPTAAVQKVVLAAQGVAGIAGGLQGREGGMATRGKAGAQVGPGIRMGQEVAGIGYNPSAPTAKQGCKCCVS
ncbi:unnamed protein product [Chrysoparadoxa australica]